MSHLRPAPSADSATAVARPWTVRRKTPHLPARKAAQQTGPTRRYDVACLDEDGLPTAFARVAPAIPAFEHAFSAVARGSLIQTVDGPVAVEDLEPGQMLETDRGPTQLVWIGAITLLPGMPAEAPAKLYRVPADAFGLGRPMPDLMLAPAARLLRRSPTLRDSVGTDKALTPIRPLADGMSVVEITPLSPVRVFHLGCARHRILQANGVEIESYHPGAGLPAGLDERMAQLFLSLFPHIGKMSDFGPTALPQLSEEDADALDVA